MEVGPESSAIVVETLETVGGSLALVTSILNGSRETESVPSDTEITIPEVDPTC